MTKVGLIGCPKTADLFWEAREIKAAKEGSGVFRDIGPVEIIGCVACDGCPGKKLTDRAGILYRCGADIIAFSSGSSGKCPHRAALLSALTKRLKTAIVLDGIGDKGETAPPSAAGNTLAGGA